MGRLDDPDYYYNKRLAKQKKALKTTVEIPKYIIQNGVLYERIGFKSTIEPIKPIKPIVDNEIKVVENIIISFK
jgi:ERCC4-type nuclease